MTNRTSQSGAYDATNLTGGASARPAGPFSDNQIGKTTHGLPSAGDQPMLSQVGQPPAHPYPFPPNGAPRNAADEIANAIWEHSK